MEFADRVAQGNGLDTVAVYAHDRMVEALSFYVALGYVETDRRAEGGDARVTAPAP
jgi:hypothetical protein